MATHITVSVSDEKMDELRLLMAICHLETHKDLLNNALTIFEWAVKERMGGREIASLDEGGARYRVLKIPCLDGISL